MENTKDRELVISRLLDAPRDLVWKVWSDPEHIKNWWGPNGFTNTIHVMEFEPGGIWEFVMHGPDGTDYRNKSTFIEIIEPEKIVFEHQTGPKFVTTVLFHDRGDKTEIVWHMLFESVEQFQQTIRVFKADKGLEENIVKLNTYLKNAC